MAVSNIYSNPLMLLTAASRLNVLCCHPVHGLEVLDAMPKCECDQQQVRNPIMDSWYSDAERPFMEHAPNECKCTIDLRRYKRGDRVMWLCSVCRFSDDKEIE